VTRRPVEALWAAEEGLRAGRVAVVAEVDALDLTASRRLQLAAEAGGGPGFVLRRGAGGRTASAARSRWRVAAAPGDDRLPVGVGRSRWQVTLARCRGGREGDWLLEWDDATDHLAVAAGLGDRPLAAPARRAG
jgi:protein ImuA